jgi:hypothetical protein
VNRKPDILVDVLRHDDLDISQVVRVGDQEKRRTDAVVHLSLLWCTRSVIVHFGLFPDREPLIVESKLWLPVFQIHRVVRLTNGLVTEWYSNDRRVVEQTKDEKRKKKSRRASEGSRTWSTGTCTQLLLFGS